RKAVRARPANCAAPFTFDVDAESPLLAERPDLADRMSTMSHQAYGPEVGVPRLLRMLSDCPIRSTFFVPGYTATRYPEAIKAIAAEGHEIGHHGYLHEPLTGRTAEQEAAILDQGLMTLSEVVGVRPVGYRAPSPGSTILELNSRIWLKKRSDGRLA